MAERRTAPTGRGATVADVERRLALPPAAGRFDASLLEGLPEPVQRYLAAAVAPGTPLFRSARLRMRGALKLNGRWLPFRARQVLAPYHGFVWRARVAGVITGSDHCWGGEGAMDWRLLGLVPVAHADGADVARSGAGRAAGESVWLPTGLLPGTGVGWSATDATHLDARVRVGDVETVLGLVVDDGGRLESVTFDRWGDPDGAGDFAIRPMGLEVTATRTFGGLTIPAAGSVGWFPGGDAWSDGEFFRFEITALDPVGDRP